MDRELQCYGCSLTRTSAQELMRKKPLQLVLLLDHPIVLHSERSQECQSPGERGNSLSGNRESLYSLMATLMKSLVIKKPVSEQYNSMSKFESNTNGICVILHLSS